MRQILRHGTRSSHDALDSVLGSLDLADRHQYARFLRAHRIGLTPLVPAYRGFVTDVLDLNPPDYLTMLDDDLAAIDIRPEQLPCVTDVQTSPNGLDPAAVCYVVSGSRLGLASMRKQPYWGACNGAGAYIEDTSGLVIWRALLAWMDHQVVREPRAATLIASADAAFAIFRRAYELSA